MGSGLVIDALRIEFEWLDLEAGSEIDRAFFASIGFALGDEYLTRLEDLSAKTVRNHMRGSAWQLASWLAANWWRLRWEPAPARWWKDTDWRLAHSMAAAGGGHVWPNAVFSSDGDYVEIVAKPTSRTIPYEPIHYLNHIQARVFAGDFEQRIDEFMEAVLARLDTLRLKDNFLARLWREVRSERSDSEAGERRKLEAMAGFDPDAAPDELLEQLMESKDRLGESAVEEVAAEARNATGKALRPLLELSANGKGPNKGGFKITMPDLDAEIAGASTGGLPWQRATKLAALARETWGFGHRPISNRTLADLVAADRRIFESEEIGPTDMPVAFRTEAYDTYEVYFSRSWEASRRFALSRLLGDHLYFANRERLRPATTTKTSRQKFQRAFAQEFLCPFDALMDRIRTDHPQEDDISDAAAYFNVSPLLISSTLVNKGRLEREALFDVIPS